MAKKRSDDQMIEPYILETRALIKRLKVRMAPVSQFRTDRTHVDFKQLQVWQTITMLAIQQVKRGQLALAEKNLTGMLAKLAEILNDAIATKKMAAKFKREGRARRAAKREAKLNRDGRK
jgi:hypothetical protein